jgi:hypothetical protein
VERREFLLVVLVVGTIVFAYSLLRGGSVIEAAVGGGFLGFVVAYAIHLGLEKIHEP